MRIMARRIGLAALLALMTAGPALPQTPPSSAEAAAYRGLHTAAWRGETDEVGRLIRAGADPNQRDDNGRTPLRAFGGR